MARVRQAAGVLAAATALWALAGCDGGESDEPEPITGAPREVARTVQQLGAATRRRQFARICDRLMTPAARRRAGGDDCARLTAEAASNVRRPRIRILSITIRGDRAEARVRTRAQGQRAVEETIVLRRHEGGYRIEALRG